jgi:hypothetical protein
MSRYYEKLPENFHQMSDEEIQTWVENIWQKINTECNLIDRDTRLQLRQQAYSIWRNKFPNENDDDNECHLEEIHSWLLSEYLKPNP